jgi:tripartite-type tricarboxylate transporter receptor subunit TctC
VPAPAKTKLEAAFKKAYDDPEFQQLARKSNLDLYYRTPDQFIKFLEKQYPIVRDTLKGMGFAK